ncbi:hypothetical protein ABZ734_15630 [Streptomyces sp. NPDC006660]|uniref:hypothetical protein n=1 Tax=Streptomyces sp. NPDC006660 TaxID=3156901 RepID=UPI0033DBFAB2
MPLDHDARESGGLVPKDVFYQGRRKREVALRPEPGIQTLVEFRASTAFLSSFFVGGLVRTDRREEREPASIITWGRKPYRFLLEPKYTHAYVERVSDSNSGGGFARWHLRAGPATSARTLSATETGCATDVLRCTGPARSVGYAFSPKFAVQGFDVRHFSEDGKKITELIDPSVLRGTFRIPGPGYVQIETSGPWEITL